MAASPSTPAEMRAYIVERMVGNTAEPDKVVAAAATLATAAARGLAERLETLLAAPLPVEVGRVALGRIGDFAAHAASDGALLVQASGPDAPDAVLMLLDAAALTLIVSAMFGGDASAGIVPIAREPSAIEAEVGAAVLGELAKALDAGGLNLVLPLAEPLFGVQARKAAFRDGPAVRVSLRVGTASAGGEIHLFLVQRALLQRREAVSADGDWGPRIGEGIMRAGVALDAVMPLGRMTLGAIAAFAPGAVVPLEAGAEAQARLLVRGHVLYRCEFGRLGTQYTVRIKEPWSEAQDFMDGLLPD